MLRMQEMALGRETGEQQNVRPAFTFPTALPQHHSESLGTCACCSYPFRSQTYSLATFSLAVLAEMSLITQEWLAERPLT